MQYINKVITIKPDTIDLSMRDKWIFDKISQFKYIKIKSNKKIIIKFNSMDNDYIIVEDEFILDNKFLINNIFVSNLETSDIDVEIFWI